MTTILFRDDMLVGCPVTVQGTAMGATDSGKASAGPNGSWPSQGTDVTSKPFTATKNELAGGCWILGAAHTDDPKTQAQLVVAWCVSLIEARHADIERTHRALPYYEGRGLKDVVARFESQIAEYQRTIAKYEQRIKAARAEIARLDATTW